MFELFFGLIWTVMSGFAAIAIIITALDVGFIEMIFPIIFVSIFLLIGFVVLYIGLRKIFKNISTKIKGIETYGYIVDICGNGCYVNGNLLYDAEVLLVEEDGTLGRYKENIGTKYNDYYPGIYVSVKHYKDDVNILEIVYEGSVPYNIKNKIEEEINNSNSRKYENLDSDKSFDNEEIIVVDDVEYVRKK